MTFDPTNYFTSVTKIRAQTGAGNAPPVATPNDQPVLIHLHGSSGQFEVGFGDDWEAVDNEGKFLYHVHNNGGYDKPPRLELQATDWIDHISLHTETLWFGAIRGTVAVPFTQRRVLAMITLFNQQYPQASVTKRSADGNSMGGWGDILFLAKHPELVASIMAGAPMWREWEVLNTTNQRVAAAATLATDTGPLFSAYMDTLAYLAVPTNQTPFLMWGIGKLDQYAAWADQKLAHYACQGKRGYAWAWNASDHSGYPEAVARVQTSTSYSPDLFQIGKGYPILFGSTLDQNPETDSVGGVNLGFAWDGVDETATTWTIRGLRNSLGAVTVNLLPYSSIFTSVVPAQAVTIAAGAKVNVTFNAVLGQPTLPVAPTNFVATLRADFSEVDCSWNPVPGADSYVMHRSNDGSDPESLPAIWSGAGTTMSDPVTQTNVAQTLMYCPAGANAAGAGPCSPDAMITVPAIIGAPPPKTDAEKLAELWAAGLAHGWVTP